MKVYELLDSPEKWTKGANARNAHGEYCYSLSPDAVRWCMAGAVRRCYELSDFTDDVFQRLNIRIRTTQYTALGAWNDAPERKYEDVIAVAKELDI